MDRGNTRVAPVLASAGCASQSDLRRGRDGAPGGIEDPVFRQELVGALGLAFVVTAQQPALEREDLDLALVDAHHDLGVRRGGERAA